MVKSSGKARSQAAGMAAGILGVGGLLVAWQGRGQVKRFAVSRFAVLFGWPSRCRLLLVLVAVHGWPRSSPAGSARDIPISPLSSFGQPPSRAGRSSWRRSAGQHPASEG